MSETETGQLSAIESVAAEANSVENWNRIWSNPAESKWREAFLDAVYDRITELVPEGVSVLDVGGGVGTLAVKLQQKRGCSCTVLDHSEEAIRRAKLQGVDGVVAAVSAETELPEADVVVSTELIEHLDEASRAALLRDAAKAKSALISMPNNRLGPEQESQHTIDLTALGFLNLLRSVWGKRCRVEAVGLGVNVEHDTRPYLLGVCGQAADKPYTMTVCFPARDEAADIELTLASFRGVADEMIIGIDPRTKDATREIAERYAEVVFDLDRPKGPEDDEAPSDGVHFSWIRNQCLDRASSDWIFMTEAHERLFEGQDRLLDLTSYVPRWAKMVAVSRTGNGMRWGFPWLTRRDSNIRYLRMTHNSPELPPEPVVGMREIVTRHERAKERAIARNKQRDVQNRKTLLEDWLVNHNVRSLHYLGAEYRSYSLEKSAQRLQQYLDEEHKDGYLRYHTRLLLSEVLVKLDRKNEAREVLMSATEDDWSRTEHWMRLGDLALERENFEEALQLYKYSATTIGRPPFGGWWIRESCYSYLPAQRLTQTHARLGQLDEALYWAKRVLELFPEDVAQANIEEAQAVVDTIEEHMARRRTKEVA